ncbi:MAG: type II secretion system F family protein [Dehalococcoidia bacterium]|nr:type II secretion system F family protein [Dehalococcoidia bacterium]
MLVVLALALIFAAIVFLVLGMSWQQDSTMSMRLATLRGERPAADFRAATPRESIGARLVAPMAASMGGKVQAFLPTRWIDGIEKNLIQAGQPVTLTGFLFASLLVLGLTLTMGFTLATASGGLTGMGLLLFGVLGAFGVVMPKVWLSKRVKYRQKIILKSLPDAFDLITTCVEAGMGLEAALAKVAEKVEGPFGEELAICLREVSLGKLRRDALKELAERTGVPDLSAFINAVVQAETMGTSIATVLRVQAEQMRTKRRQRAEQQAYQAPVKMIFPLVLCIFPTLFIVILGPAGITIYQTLIAQE